MLVLYCYLQHHNDTIIKTQEVFFRKICSSHFIARVEKGYSRFACERELEIEHNCNILTPYSYGRQRCVFLILQGCSTGGPGPTLLGVDFLYCILSASSLDPNSSGPQASSAWCGFPYHSRLQLLCQLYCNLNSTGT